MWQGAHVIKPPREQWCSRTDKDGLMANFLSDLRAKRDAGEINTSSTSVKIAGEGHFTVKLTAAEWGKNRTGDAEQGKLSFSVIGLRKDTTDKNEIGATFSEYVSLKNEEMAQKKYLQISDWLQAAGVKDDKMIDEDDETIAEALRTLIHAADKYCSKRDIVANCFRKASDKVDSQGRPYYNNYFDDPNASEGEEEVAQEAPKPQPKAEAPKAKATLGTSPYKNNKHAVADEDED